MYIDVEKLKQEKYSTRHYDFNLNLPYLMVGHEKIMVKGPIKVASSATFTNKDILVEGTITAQLELNCHRCLEKFIYNLEAPFKERFVTSSEYKTLTESEKMQEDISWYQNGKINLEPLVEQIIYLSLPMKVMCKEDCLGLCSKCGSSLNIKKCDCKDEEIDPRLAVLQQLLKK